MNRKKGIMLSEIPFRNMPVLLKECGFDYFIVDTEHGGFDYSVLSSLMITAKLCKIQCVVRLPDNSRREVTRMMDMGASGLLLPMTDDAEQIARVAEFSKYYPEGTRGISTMRPHTLYHPGNLEEYMHFANRNTHIFAQIETMQGVNNLQDILDTKGVAGVFIGPNDLACDIGFPEDKKQKIRSEILRIGSICNANEKFCGIITSDKDYIDAAKEAELTHYCIGSELSLLKQAATATIKLIEE